jgi:hypothetical protein
LELRRKAGCSGKSGTVRVVYSDALQVFALAEAFDERLDAAVGLSIEQRFDGVLESVAENRCTVREIAAEDALLRMHLIRGEEQTAGSHADDKREHHFQSSAHQLLNLTRPRFRNFANKSLHDSQQAAEQSYPATLEAECLPVFCTALAAARPRSAPSPSNAKWP